VRIRSIKPEWLDDEAMVSVSDAARVMTVALILLADDHGRGRSNEMMMAGRVFPMDGARGPEKVREALRELSRMGFVTLYEVRGQSYYAIRNWEKHQKVDKPGKPRVPSPEEGEITGVHPIPEKVLGASEKVRERFATDLDQDLDQDHDRDPRAREGEEPPRTTKGLLIGGYQRRYEAARDVAWQSAPRYATHFEAAARWCDTQAARERCGPGDVAERLLDGLFADPWAIGNDYPPKLLESQPGRLYAPPAKPVVGELSPEERERLELQIRDRMGRGLA
jgi:hypothetical protein